mgnify:CR=1 FL=1
MIARRNALSFVIGFGSFGFRLLLALELDLIHVFVALAARSGLGLLFFLLLGFGQFLGRDRRGRGRRRPALQHDLRVVDDAAMRGARQVFFAVVATTVVLVSVFAPLMFMPGLGNFLFRPLFLSVAVAMVIAFVLPVSMHPMALAGFPVAVAVLLGLASLLFVAATKARRQGPPLPTARLGMITLPDARRPARNDVSSSASASACAAIVGSLVGRSDQLPAAQTAAATCSDRNSASSCLRICTASRDSSTSTSAHDTVPSLGTSRIIRAP